jgi:hypothetical protein
MVYSFIIIYIFNKVYLSIKIALFCSYGANVESTNIRHDGTCMGEFN